MSVNPFNPLSSSQVSGVNKRRRPEPQTEEQIAERMRYVLLPILVAGEGPVERLSVIPMGPPVEGKLKKEESLEEISQTPPELN